MANEKCDLEILKIDVLNVRKYVALLEDLS